MTDTYANGTVRITDIKQVEDVVLTGLQFKPHIYQGTVPEGVVAGRREKNRAARRARRGNVAGLRRQARIAHGRNKSNPRPRKYIEIDGITPPIDAEVVED